MDPTPPGLATDKPPARPPAVADRYRAIVQGMAQGFCLIEVLFDEHETAVDYRFLEINAAFTQQTTLRDPVGRTVRALVPQLEAHWYQLYGEVVRTGQLAHFEQRAQLDGDYWYEVYALPSGPPGSRQLAVFFTDVTARHNTEEALRSSQDHQAFLLRLSDALRPLDAPAAIADAACRLLVAQLGASQVQYTLVEGGPGAELGWAAGAGTQPGQRFANSFPLASYIEPLIALLRANETLVLSDTGRDPRLTSAQRAAFLAVASPAMIAVPLVKEGSFVAVLTVHGAAPRPWIAHEVRQVEEVAERTWAAVARARAEIALREKEQQQAFVVHLADGLRACSEAGEIPAVAARLLGQHLGANQVHYGETQGEDIVIHQGYGDGLPPVAGRFRPLDFGEKLTAAFRRGVVQAVPNVETHASITDAERQVLRAARIGAYVAVPLRKAGQWVATLAVHSLAPRLWSPEEVHLVQEVAERTWAAVAHARAETALRQFEEQFCLFVTTSPDVVYQLSADWQQVLPLNGESFAADAAAPRATWLDTYVLPDDRALVGAAVQAAIAGRHFFELEHRVVQADGSVGWLFSRAVPVFGPRGELSAWFGTATDITPRKLAEDALSRSEGQFRAVANLVPDLLWRSDAQGTTTWYNQQWLDYTGQTLDEAVACGWADAIHPDDRAPSTQHYRAAARHGQPLRQEHRIRAATGEYRWFQVQALPFQDEQGVVSQWFGAATDIHERKLAEQVLRQSEQHLAQQVAARTHELKESRDLLQSVFDTNLLAMSVMRTLRNAAGEVEDFEIRLVNKQLERETGRPDLVGKRYAQEYPGVRPVGVFDLMLRALATGEPQGMEYYYNHEGFGQWFSCMFVKLGDGVVATSLDITLRKVAEQERTRNLQLLEQAENVAQLGSWDYDLATGQFQWSAGMYHLFGLPLGQPIAPSIYLDHVVAEDRARAEQLVHHLTTADAGDFEHTLRLRVGAQVKTVRIKAVVFPGAPGEPARVLGVDLDISELQRLEADNLHLRLGQQKALFEAIQEAQEEERRRMSESLHNGIGQLLYATKLQLDSLPAAPEPSPRHEATRLLGEAMRQVRSLSHDLTPALLEEFGLEATLQSICRTLSQPGLHWHCQLVFEEAPALPLSLQLAVYRLAQELAQNVVKHAQASQATLEAEVLPAWVVLRVEDNGRGFDPTSDGLGLRSLRSRVALLGGRVQLIAAPGQGTQCQIRLPLLPIRP